MPSSPVAIRPAAAADCAELVRLIRELARYERLEQEVECDAATLRHSLFSAHPTAYALLAEVNGIAAGFCLYFYNFSTFLGRAGIYVEDIFVREAHRGLGIGKRLFEEVFAIAATKNCGRVEWSVLDWNQPAIAFYEKLGARAMQEWTIYRMERNRFAAAARRDVTPAPARQADRL